MITRPTVLVLGAGASKPFNYPTGKELKDEITGTLKNHHSPSYLLLRHKTYDENTIEKFRSALATSSSGSIDAFLEHRREFTDIGKLAITSILAQREDTENLFANGDWYEYLFKKLNKKFDFFSFNKLSIITFNYDRSLEHFLFTALKSSYNKTDDITSSALIDIIHVHGQIGYLPWQKRNFMRPYGEKENLDMLAKSSKEIKIIHEKEIEDSKEFNKAKKLLANAGFIYFFGFGYHPENIRRLGITSLDNTNKVIQGTALHMTTREVTDIMNQFKNLIDLTQPYAQTFGILPYIRENISFI